MSSTETLKKSKTLIVDKLKYIFDNKNKGLLDCLNSMASSYKTHMEKKELQDRQQKAQKEKDAQEAININKEQPGSGLLELEFQEKDYHPSEPSEDTPQELSESKKEMPTELPSEDQQQELSESKKEMPTEPPSEDPPQETDQEADQEEEQKDEILSEIEKHNEEFIIDLFKKIKMLFIILADLLKYCIIQIDKDIYQKVADEKINFPDTLEKLIIVMGVYEEAFSFEIVKSLYDILELESFNDLYKISQINQLMIPFVANDKINQEALHKDYSTFSCHVKNIACLILNTNTEFNDESYID